MLNLFLMIIVGLGVLIFLRVRKETIFIVFAIFYTLVLFLIITLAENNPIKTGLGASLNEWLSIGVIFAALYGYILVLRKIKKSNTLKYSNDSTKGEMTRVEVERYARHLVLKEIGGQGQQKLRNAKVLLIGAGGLGNPIAMYLAGAGVGNIGIIDNDKVSLSNLQRQILYRDDNIGQPKVFASQKNILELNPHITIKPYNRALDYNNVQKLISEYDVIVDGTDNIKTRHLVNLGCFKEKKPLISGAISQWEGQISLFDPANNYPCYSCIFPESPADNLAKSCADVGVLSSLPGVIGSIMAVEVIKELTGVGDNLRGQLFLYDALSCKTRKIEIEKDKNCKICSRNLN